MVRLSRINFSHKFVFMFCTLFAQSCSKTNDKIRRTRTIFFFIKTINSSKDICIIYIYILYICMKTIWALSFLDAFWNRKLSKTLTNLSTIRERNSRRLYYDPKIRLNGRALQTLQARGGHLSLYDILYGNVIIKVSISSHRKCHG